ncbi:MAG: SIMPL domain-containing protein [Patescibacteria group bacterium]
METKHNKLIIASLALATTALLVSLLGGKDITLNPNVQEHTITVQGESDRLVVPDTAKVSLTMTRKSANLSQGTDSVNKRIGEMIDALSEYSVDKKDIKTTTYSVQPEYNYMRESGERVFDGYRVRQTVELTIRDLDKVAPILTKISSFEVDNVSGLSFFVDEDEKIKNELREEAIADAKEKAKILARNLGVSLDSIVSFNEGGGSMPPYPIYEERMYLEARDSSVSNAVVPTGENEYTSQVSITYLIEN